MLTRGSVTCGELLHVHTRPAPGRSVWKASRAPAGGRRRTSRCRSAFIEAEMGIPHHLDRRVHSLLFSPAVSRVPASHGVELEQFLHRLSWNWNRARVPGDVETRAFLVG